jgi:hypothetical protein
MNLGPNVEPIIIKYLFHFTATHVYSKLKFFFKIWKMNVMEENSFNENSKWVNVQEPVKDMILAIAKSVRTQSAGIRDLDRKLGQCILTEKCEKLIHEGVTNCLSKKV